MAKKNSKYKLGPFIDLRALEEEVLVEGREWMQKRMEEKLRQKRESFSPGGEKTPPPGAAAQADDSNPLRRCHSPGRVRP